MAYCYKCGAQVPDNASFCGKCGTRLQGGAGGSTGGGNGGSAAGASGGGGSVISDAGSKISDAASSFVGGINDYLGNTNAVNLNWKDLFSGVMKKHTREEAEEVFICGTSRTTPALDEVSATWPKPWLYSRVFLCFAVTYFLLYILSVTFNNMLAYPGLIIVGAFAVPFTTMVLFLEVNAFRNISVYDVMKFFLVGGCASLVVTMFLFDLEVVDTDLSSTWGAMMVGVIEEIGKLVIVYLLIKQLSSCNYILSALLAGACVGAGFAAFESAGYAMMPMLQIANIAGAYGVAMPTEMMMDNVTTSIYLRGFLAPGGHVAWAAITGAALIIAKGSGPLTTSVLTSSRFLKIFAIPVVLHGLWDAPIFSGIPKLIVLIVLVWIVVLILVNMGLDEVKKLKGA